MDQTNELTERADDLKRESWVSAQEAKVLLLKEGQELSVVVPDIEAYQRFKGRLHRLKKQGIIVSTRLKKSTLKLTRK